MTGLRGLGYLDRAAGASYMERDDLPLKDPESAVHDEVEELGIDVVPESDPLSDRVLQALVEDLRAEALQVSGID